MSTILSGKNYAGSFGPLHPVLQVWTMWITCEPITYFMLNGLECITNDRITYTNPLLYITIYDIMTDLKGSEGPRNTLMYRKFY